MTTDETKNTPTEPATSEKKTPIIPPKRIPLPPVKHPFQNMQRGGNMKGGSKIGTKIQKHAAKGR